MRTMQFISFLALYIWSGDAQANDNQYFAAYAKETISVCELRNLGSYWNKTQADTKIAIGKARTEKKELLPIIQKANTQARDSGVADCDFWQLDFRYEDAEIMGKVWGIDTYEAKSKLASYAANQSFAAAKKLVQIHTPAPTAPVVYPNQSSEDAFFSSKYDWCHAKMLSKAYSISEVYEAKVWMGDLLRTGKQGLLEKKMDYARGKAEKNPQTQCSFAETMFNYKDAEKLAAMWSMTTAEAKVSLQNKYLHGLEWSLKERLNR